MKALALMFNRLLIKCARRHKLCKYAYGEVKIAQRTVHTKCLLEDDLLKDCNMQEDEEDGR